MQMELKKSEKLCSICREPYSGHGHVAEPVNKGFCCDECNTKIVLPARLLVRKGNYWDFE